MACIRMRSPAAHEAPYNMRMHRECMHRGSARGSVARSRFERMLWVCCALFALALTAEPAAASRPVRVYEVVVRGTDSSASIQEAMREALVRATGQRQAASDPALQGLVMNASRFVTSSRPLSDGSTQVVFDGPAIEKEIMAAGRSVWGSERPFIVVVLNPTLSGPEGDAARRMLEDLGEVRGLPITLVPMATTDPAGNALTSDALLQSAQRLGGDAVLLGRSDIAGPATGSTAAAVGQPSNAQAAAAGIATAGGPTMQISASVAASSPWQWTLLTGFSAESWNGNFEAGVNGAADAFARVQDTSVPQTESDALVEVSGIGSLADYATVERMLSQIPGVRRSGLEEAEGTTATFRVLIRGGSEAVERALANSARLAHTGAANARLQYQLHP